MTRIAAIAALVFAAALAATAPARASGSSSGTLTVRGTVATVCTVSVQDLGKNLDLIRGASSEVVARVTENCNDGDGYTVTVTSAQSGKLVNASDPNAKIGYTVDYDTAHGRSLGAPLTISHNKAAFDETKDLKVSVQGGTDRIAGDYSDTLTVTISAN